MTETANIEKKLLETMRSLSEVQQEVVLNFARSLQTVNSEQPLKLSLQQIVKLPVAERYKLLAAYIPATAQDFLSEPELTEFSVLDIENWED